MSDQSDNTIRKAGWLPRLFTAVLPRARPFQEMGVSGTPVYAGYVLTPEKSPALVGQQKYRTFSEMLANISILAAGVRYFLNIVSKPGWSCEASEESKDEKGGKDVGGRTSPSKDEGEKYSDFVEEVLFDNLDTSWSRIVRRCGTYRFHGFNIQEWTAKRRDDGQIGFADIESRPQWTIWRWEVDEQGSVIGCWQRDPLTGRELGLPRSKLMYLVDDTLSDNPEGMGLLRHCYEPARRLEEYLRQEGFGYLRDLQGIPLGRAPIADMQNLVNAKKMSQAQMDDSLQRLQDFVSIEKKDRKTGLVVDSQPFVSVADTGISIASAMKWGVELIQGGKPSVEAMNTAIVRLNTEIARILGVEHLLLGADAEGSYALAKEKARDLYLLANSVLRDIREQVEKDIIPPLWKLNGFDEDVMPKLKTEDVSPQDAEQIARVLRDMATAGSTLAPDDEIQNSMRDLLGMPHVDLEKLSQMYSLGEVQTGIPGAAGQQKPGQPGQQPGQAPKPLAYQQDVEDRMDAALAKPKGPMTKAEVKPKTNGKQDPQKQQEQQEPQHASVTDHAAATQAVATFMQAKSAAISSAITSYAQEHEIELADETALGVALYKLFTKTLVAALGGGVTGFSVEDLMLTAAEQIVDTTRKLGKLSPEDAKGMAFEVGKCLISGVVRGPVATTQKAAAPMQGQPVIAGANPAAANPAAGNQKPGGKAQQQQQQPQTNGSQPDPQAQIMHALTELVAAILNFGKRQVSKMVPYKQAKPYRWEDDTFPKRSGSPDGGMNEKVESYFDTRGGIQGRSQGPYGSMKGTEDQEPPLNLGDDMVPGSRMRTKGRRRIVP